MPSPAPPQGEASRQYRLKRDDFTNKKMQVTNKSRRSTRGQSLVETALMLPLLILIVLNVVNFHFFPVAVNPPASRNNDDVGGSRALRLRQPRSYPSCARPEHHPLVRQTCLAFKIRRGP